MFLLNENQFKAFRKSRNKRNATVTIEIKERIILVTEQ